MTGRPLPRAPGYAPHPARGPDPALAPRPTRVMPTTEEGIDEVEAIYALYQDYFAATQPRPVTPQRPAVATAAPPRTRALGDLLSALGLRDEAAEPPAVVSAPVRRPPPQPSRPWRACEILAAEVLQLVANVDHLAGQIRAAQPTELAGILQAGSMHETYLCHILERARRRSYAEGAFDVWAQILAAVRGALVGHMGACIERSTREPPPSLRRLIGAQRQARHEHRLVVLIAGIRVAVPLALPTIDPWADQELFAEAGQEWVALYRGIAHQAARLPPAGDMRLVVHAPHRYITLGLTPGQTSAHWLQRANALYTRYRAISSQPVAQ